MAGQYGSYSVLGDSGGGGGVSSLNGETGAVNIVAGTGITVTPAGQNITIAATGSAPVGPANTFAGFDNTGALEGVPGFNINGNNGLDEDLTQSPNNLGFQTQNTLNVNFTPLQDSPNEGWNIQSIQANLDSGSSGFSQGTAGTAVQLLNLDITHHGTGDVGGLVNITMNSDIGNGTDPISVKGLAMSFGFGQIHANVTLDGSMQGYTFQPNVDAAAIGTSNFSVSGFQDVANIGIPTNGYNNFSAGPTVFAITNNHGYGGVNINPTITTFQGNSGYTGFGSYGNITTMSATGQYSGLQVNPNITTSHGNINGIQISPNVAGGDANFTGITINPSGAVVFGSAQGISINLNSITSNDPQGVTGINSDSRLSVNAQTTLKSAQGFQIGNRVESLLHVPPGSPVTGTDSLGNDFAGDLSAEDSIALGPIGLGWASVGFIADMAVAVGKTVAAVDVFVPAVALPDPGYTTGGAVTDMTMIRTFAPLSQGGTIAITNLYGFKIDSSIGGPFSAAATNTWGLYLQDPALNNFIEGKLGIGSGATTPHGNLDVIGTVVQGDGTTRATGGFAVALGASTNIGVTGLSSGDRSLSGGLDCLASGNSSLAFGETCSAVQTRAVAMGNGTTASGFQSFALGNGVQATSNNAFATGRSASPGSTGLASGNSSFHQGLDGIASGDHSSVFGEGSLSQADDQTTVGQYNVAVGTPSSPASTDEIFTVGNGANSGSRATAFAVRRDALVYIHNGHFRSTQTTPPTVAAQAGAGTGASASVSNATDIAGKLELITGTVTLAAGAQVVVTFNSPYATAPIVTLTPNNTNAAAAAVAMYVTSTTTTFTVNFVTASVGTLTYDWFYHVIETA